VRCSAPLHQTTSGMSGELRIGLIGCGRVAERAYVPAVAEVPGVRLAAVADHVSGRCADAAPGVPAFTSAVELIDAGAADALVLATPARSHLADARLAAAAGLPTLIEKPPASTLAEASELARLVPAPRLAFNRRFVPELGSLRAVLSNAPRLDLTLAMSTRSSSWGSHEVADDALDNLGSHLVDLTRWLSGAEIASVAADVAPRRARL